MWVIIATISDSFVFGSSWHNPAFAATDLHSGAVMLTDAASNYKYADS